jgi:Right handed beta helix region
VIERCHLGMDPAGTLRTPNGTRGAQIEGGRITVTDSLLGGNFRSGGWFETDKDATIARNRFTDNGASGLYARITPGTYNLVTVADNLIAGNAHAGISLSRESIGSYAQNSFPGNLGRAIDIGIDGPTLAMAPGLPGRGGIVGAPVITSVRFENGETVIEARIAPRSPWNVYLGEIVHFYANPVPKDGGELIGTVNPNPGDRGGQVFTLRVPRDLRGQWVSAATFAIYIYNWDDAAPGTSEVGLPRLVE